MNNCKCADKRRCCCEATAIQIAAPPTEDLPTANADLLTLLRSCVSAMEMQMGRESGELHINQPTARKIWDDALLKANAAIEYHDAHANDLYLNLDVEEWKAMKLEIQNSPRFAEMYRAGGVFTDACSSVRIWLREEDPSISLNADGPSR